MLIFQKKKQKHGTEKFRVVCGISLLCVNAGAGNVVFFAVGICIFLVNEFFDYAVCTDNGSGNCENNKDNLNNFFVSAHNKPP